MKNLFNLVSTTVVTAAFIAIPLIANVSGAYATGNTTVNLSIPVSTVVFGDVGSMHEVASKDIAANYVGMTCDVSAGAENQSSIHPGNDLIIKSGNSSVVLEDVERAANVSTEANGQLTLSDKVTVTLEIGQDKVFSAGMNVALTCVKNKIEVCRDGEIITIFESERSETDTDTCPVDEKIKVCRDNNIIEINASDKQSTDTDTCATPKGFSVCRDGEVIQITENDLRETDVKSETCPQEPKVLPITGTASMSLVLASILGAGVLGQVATNKREV